jgi:hypothetical protein
MIVSGLPMGKSFLWFMDVFCGYVLRVIVVVMPAQATLFNLKCEPLVDFGAAPRNTIRWNNSSRCILNNVTINYYSVTSY